MKTIFEEKDINCWMYLIKNTSPIGSTNYSFANSVMYKVGFLITNSKPCLISMTDGMVVTFDSKKELCEHLNNCKKGFRLLTIKQMTDILRKDYIANMK